MTNSLKSKKAELVMVAKSVLDGEINLIEGARKICSLRLAVGCPDDDVFMTIRAIESDTDHFPLGEMRSHCASNYLIKMDAEMYNYIDDAKQDMMNACREIVRIFSESNGCS